MSDYRLVAQQREASGEKQAKPDVNRNNRIVIEPAEPEKSARPPQKNWPPKVTDPNSYDRNVVDPYDPSYSKRPGAAEPVKKA